MFLKHFVRNSTTAVYLHRFHWPESKVNSRQSKQGGKGVLVLPNTKDMTRSTKWVWLKLDTKYVRKKNAVMLKIKLMKMTKLFKQRNLVIVDPNITQ